MVWLVARSAEDLLDTVLATTGIHGDEFAIYSILAAIPRHHTQRTQPMDGCTGDIGLQLREKAREPAGTSPADPTPKTAAPTASTSPPPENEPTRQPSTSSDPSAPRSSSHSATRTVRVRESLLRLRSVVDELRTDAKNAHSAPPDADQLSRNTKPPSTA